MPYDEKLVFGQDSEAKPNELWEECMSKAVRNKTNEITAKIFNN